MKMREQEVCIQADFAYENLKLVPTIENKTSQEDPDFAQKLYDIFLELPKPLQFGKDNFKESIKDKDTIINTLRLNDSNGEIIGFSKGGPLEKYQLREEIRDENFGLKNTVFLEPLALKMGYWGLRGGSEMRHMFIMQAHSMKYKYLTSFALRDVVRARIMKEDAEFVQLFDPERWDYYRVKNYKIQMKKSILKLLESKIKGEVHNEKYFRNFYSVDSSSYQLIPQIVVIPIDEEDIIKTIKIAKKYKTSVTVRGAGTGLVGSALNHGIIIDMKKINFIKINKKSAIVGSGILKGKLDIELQKKGKFFPPNPSIGNFCSLGGMLGNNSSGSRSVKYGSTIDNVKEVTIIDGNGKKIQLPKNKKISKKIFQNILIDDKKNPKNF